MRKRGEAQNKNWIVRQRKWLVSRRTHNDRLLLLLLLWIRGGADQCVMSPAPVYQQQSNRAHAPAAQTLDRNLDFVGPPTQLHGCASIMLILCFLHRSLFYWTTDCTFVHFPSIKQHTQHTHTMDDGWQTLRFARPAGRVCDTTSNTHTEKPNCRAANSRPREPIHVKVCSSLVCPAKERSKELYRSCCCAKQLPIAQCFLLIFKFYRLLLLLLSLILFSSLMKHTHTQPNKTKATKAF